VNSYSFLIEYLLPTPPTSAQSTVIQRIPAHIQQPIIVGFAR